MNLVRDRTEAVRRRSASVEVLADVDDAAGDDGRAHADDGGLLHEVEAGAKYRAPASVLVHPSADLKKSSHAKRAWQLLVWFQLVSEIRSSNTTFIKKKPPE